MILKLTPFLSGELSIDFSIDNSLFDLYDFIYLFEPQLTIEFLTPAKCISNLEFIFFFLRGVDNSAIGFISDFASVDC
jgi:hypothetical protein